MTLSDLNKIDRINESPWEEDSFFSDLLWSDPIHDRPREEMKKHNYTENPRGAGKVFGLIPSRKFLN